MLSLLTLFFLTVLAMWIAKRQTWHPLFWFPLIFFLYSSWYSISTTILLGEFSSANVHASNLNAVAFVFFSFGVLIPSIEISSQKFVLRISSLPTHRLYLLPFENSIFKVTVFLLLVGLLLVFLSGSASKHEAKTSIYNSLPFFSVIWSIFFLLGTRIFLLFFASTRQTSPNVPTSNIVAIFICSLLSWLVLGEREFLYGFALLGLLIVCAKYRGGKAFAIMALASVLLIISIPLTQFFKNSFIDADRTLHDPMTEIFGRELAAPGRNLVFLIETDASMPLSEVIKREVGRAFSSNLLGGEQEGMAQWYNSVFRLQENVDGTSGWGFTLIGSGYVAYGAIGVAVLFLSFGTILGFLYKKSSTSNLYLSLYIAIIPLAIYSIRQDFSYLLGGILKQTLSPLIFIYLLSALIRLRRNRWLAR